MQEMKHRNSNQMRYFEVVDITLWSFRVIVLITAAGKWSWVYAIGPPESDAVADTQSGKRCCWAVILHITSRHYHVDVH